jgi:DNA primase
LGEGHFDLLRKYTNRAILMFDADEAGKGAADKGRSPLVQRVMELFIAQPPMGRDPAEIVQSDGPEGVRKLIDAKQPLWEFALERAITSAPLDTAEARSAGVRRAVELLALHPDPIARHEYAFKGAELIGVDPEVMQRALSELRFEASDVPERGTEKSDRRFPGHVKVEREALHLLLTHVSETQEWTDRISDSDFTSAARRDVLRVALNQREKGDLRVLTQDMSSDAMSLLTELSVSYPQVPDDELADRVPEVFSRLKLFSLERDIRALRTTLHDVNPVEDPQRHDQLFTELVGLEASRRDLLRQMRGAEDG